MRTMTFNGRRATAWDLLKEVDEIFNGTHLSREGATEANPFQPTTDIRESEAGYLMAFDLPGVKQKDVKIALQEDVLTVSGERRRHDSHEDKGQGWTRTERSFGRFQRSFQLPKEIDHAKIEAQFEDGVLQLFLPRAAAAKPIEIQIQTSAPKEGEKKGLMEKFFSSTKTVEAKNLNPQH